MKLFALFIMRAQAVKPTFSVTNETLPAVAEICIRLDGPHTKKLAAARNLPFPLEAPPPAASTSVFKLPTRGPCAIGRPVSKYCAGHRLGVTTCLTPMSSGFARLFGVCQAQPSRPAAGTVSVTQMFNP